MALARQFFVLVALGAAVGLGVDFASPHRVSLAEAIEPASASSTATCSAHEGSAPALVKRMPLTEALKACDACSAAFVDARGAAAFENGHIPGAFHLPPSGEKGAGETIAKLKTYPTVVVYDEDAKDECPLATGVADRLVAAGVRDVRVLDGSWTAWEAAQGPAVAGACEACGGTKTAESASMVTRP